MTNWQPVGWLHAEPVMQRRRAPGNTCLSALHAGAWGRVDNRINASKGCGGVMRVVPLGLVQAWAPATAFIVAAQTAAITHGHPSGYLSAAAMAAMVRMMIDGMDLLAAADEAVALLSNDPEADETISALRAATGMWRERPTDHASAVERLGEGWVGEEALAVGVYAALAGQSFREVLPSPRTTTATAIVRPALVDNSTVRGRGWLTSSRGPNNWTCLTRLCGWSSSC